MFDSHGKLIYCGHSGCMNVAHKVVSWERPDHREFRGRCHGCCIIHSRERDGQA